jgi:hypothetical protein
LGREQGFSAMTDPENFALIKVPYARRGQVMRLRLVR